MFTMYLYWSKIYLAAQRLLVCNTKCLASQFSILNFFCPNCGPPPCSCACLVGSVPWLEAGIAWEVQLETEIALRPGAVLPRFAAWSLTCNICTDFLKAVATFFHHLNWSFHHWLLERKIHCHGLLPGNGLAFHWCLMRSGCMSDLDLYQEVLFMLI